MKIFQLTEELDIKPGIINTFLTSFIISHGFLDFFKFKSINQDLPYYIILVLSNYFLFKNIPTTVLLYFLYLSVQHFDNDIIFLVKRYKLGTGYQKINRYGFGSSTFLGTLLCVENYNFYNNVIGYLIRNENKANIVYVLFLIYNLYNYLHSYYYYDRKEKLLAIALINMGYLLGPFYFILYYLSFVHLPIAMYKLLENHNQRYRMRIVHLFLSLGFILNHNAKRVLEFNYDDTITHNILYLGISVLITHMIFSTTIY